MSSITETPIYDELRRTLLDSENEEEPAHGSSTAEESTSETVTSTSGLSGTGVSTGRRSRRARH